MTSALTRPDVAKILSQLKGFQRHTVDYAFERLTAPNSTRRFLVADEVGLGKTLVARGVIARLVDHLWDEVDRIDVVYICSNADIARQNISRLNVTGDRRFELPSRLTLLPIVLTDLQRNKLNLVSFTPGTSFEPRKSKRFGRDVERVLLYWLLREAWSVRGTSALNVLQGRVRDAGVFRERVKRLKRNHEIDETLTRSFAEALDRRVQLERARGDVDVRTRFEVLCERFGRTRTSVPKEDRVQQSRLVGDLRALLAETCIRALEPDLVILDEFQRFKHLLDPEDETSVLAQELFNYASGAARAHVLLLSATPYKMYTLSHERDEDDHYEDFLRTVQFLDPPAATKGTLRSAIDEYRRELYRLADGGGERLAELKSEIETTLRRTMCRTERLAGGPAGDGMLREVPVRDVVLTPTEVGTYARLERLARELEQPNVVEYWKSAPYLLNFMEHYELKRAFVEAGEGSNGRSRLAAHLSGTGLLLPWDQIRRYGEIDPGNARLRALLGPLLEMGAWRLLWLPPSLPYHQLGEPFRTAQERDLTKRLVFSTWTVVPRAITALASYEVERRTFMALEPNPKNSTEWLDRRRGLLRFAAADGRLVGMPILAWLYPSVVLASAVDPLTLRDQTGVLLSRDEALRRIERDLAPLVAGTTKDAAQTAELDERWYWALPMLLDLAGDRDGTRAWFERDDLARRWTGIGEGSDDLESRWTEHVEQSRAVADGKVRLGRPPGDLLSVAALIALAGPAITALRALSRAAESKETMRDQAVRDAAAQVAWAFRSLFNQPESTGIVRVAHRELPYWRAVLEYSADGCLQSVLDEYCHVLRDVLGLFDRPPAESAGELAATIASALTIRTSRINVDEVRLDSRRNRVDIAEGRLRTHFALRFGAEKTEDEKQAVREDQVRTAFNSPFRPFILASTSVGQEGLDFHPYCHAVVHWNLPANPVDLEQREGRVHRYKGHAIRKNVARACGDRLGALSSSDPWAALFAMASRHVADDGHGLAPYWVFPVEGGAVVERHVPMLPLSADQVHLDALRRSLAVYRMVFGQPRQEDLLAYLLERVGSEKLAQRAELFRMNLAPIPPA